MRRAIALQSGTVTGFAPSTSQERSRRVLRAEKDAIAALFAAALLFSVQALPAQTIAATPAATGASTPAHRLLRSRTHPGAAHPLTPQVAEPPAPIPPPAPPPPDWPANDRPAQASVVWDSQGLRIDAQNSSLQQILRDFATVAGAQIEGMGADERVFGTYGPGQARDVLSELLQGSGYNVMMIGDQGQGAPRQIVLSARPTGSAQTATTNNTANANDDDADVEEPPQPPPGTPMPIRPPFPPRGPGAMNMQEQQREQQVREQQRELQMQQRNNPPN